MFEADNGLLAMDQVLAIHPNLISMELAMPKMDGGEAMRQIKAHPAVRDIPIVVCTAFSSGSHIDEALNAGAAEILHKPFKVADVNGLLQKHIAESLWS